MNRMDSIDLELKPSRRLGFFLAIVHGAAIIAVVTLPWPWWLRLIAMALITANAVALIRSRALPDGHQSLVSLKLSRDATCRLHLADGSELTGKLCRGWLATPCLIVLRVVAGEQRHRHGITLLSDSASKDDLRKLRVFLRFAIDPSAWPK